MAIAQLWRELEGHCIGDVPPEIGGWATGFLSSEADFGFIQQKLGPFTGNLRVTDSFFVGFAAIRSAQEFGPSQSLTSDPGGR
ncbi:hypothetical protein ACWDSD_30200 [Streptomyces spiralis]